MRIDVPDGDVADRITILELKLHNLSNPRQLAHVQSELDGLHAAWAAASEVMLDAVPGLDRLRVVNSELWDVEDALRALEAAQDFGPRFVALARSVYTLNDERARLKAGINDYTGSRLREQKSYA